MRKKNKEKRRKEKMDVDVIARIPCSHHITNLNNLSITKKSSNSTIRQSSNIKTSLGAIPLLFLSREIGGAPSVSVPAIPREFWVSLDPDKKKGPE